MKLPWKLAWIPLSNHTWPISVSIHTFDFTGLATRIRWMIHTSVSKLTLRDQYMTVKAVAGYSLHANPAIRPSRDNIRLLGTMQDQVNTETSIVQRLRKKLGEVSRATISRESGRRKEHDAKKVWVHLYYIYTQKDTPCRQPHCHDGLTTIMFGAAQWTCRPWQPFTVKNRAGHAYLVSAQYYLPNFPFRPTQTLSYDIRQPSWRFGAYPSLNPTRWTF